MPGIHLIRAIEGSTSPEGWHARLDDLLHDNQYVREDVYADDSTGLSVTRYPDYPVTSLRSKDCLIVLEGRLYGLSAEEVLRELEVLSVVIFDNRDDSRSVLRQWLLNHDGDFVIAMRHKRSGQWAVFNDHLGRLPLYYCRTGDVECLSREIGLVARLRDKPSLDQIGAAQYLTFGYPLGGRMLWQDVERLAPATLVRWDQKGRPSRRTAVQVYNFERTVPVTSTEAAAGFLAEHFVSACRYRADSEGRNLLSLSGGLDSRAVAIGLQEAGCDFTAVTFRHTSQPDSPDLNIARRLAEKLELQWQQVDLPAPPAGDVQKIFRLKDGLINSSQAYDVSYFAQLEGRFGRNFIHFSGDGGDKTLPDLQPRKRFTSLPELAVYILQRHQLMPLPLAGSLAGVTIDEFLDDLISLLRSYPEASLNHKYVHFMIYERAVHWLFEGEDRNRCNFWSCTPFYSPSYFSLAMSYPSELKKNHLLYREFLYRLSPQAAQVVDAGKGLALTDPAYGRKIALTSWAARYPRPARALQVLFNRPQGYHAEDTIVRILNEQLLPGGAVGERLDVDVLHRLAKRPGRLSRDSFQNLFALVAAVVERIGRPAAAWHPSDEIFS